MAPAEVRSECGGDSQLVERLRAGGESRLSQGLVRAGAPLWGREGRRKGLKLFARNQRILLEGSTRGSFPGQAHLSDKWLTTEN